MLRVLDILIAAVGMILLCPVFVLLGLVCAVDAGSPLLWQKRVGRHTKPFYLVKFRTMHPETDHVPTHLLDPSAITRSGRILRKIRLDELPQLWNVLKGEMSMVGPRPSLFVQEELIKARERLGVLDVRPGITGLAQITGINMASPEILAETDARMLKSLGPQNYFYYIWRTVFGITVHGKRPQIISQIAQ